VPVFQGNGGAVVIFVELLYEGHAPEPAGLAPGREGVKRDEQSNSKIKIPSIVALFPGQKSSSSLSLL
jgi:hypothetical protein